MLSCHFVVRPGIFSDNIGIGRLLFAHSLEIMAFVSHFKHRLCMVDTDRIDMHHEIVDILFAPIKEDIFPAYLSVAILYGLR